MGADEEQENDERRNEQSAPSFLPLSDVAV
jgi:hypothetical protein